MVQEKSKFIKEGEKKNKGRLKGKGKRRVEELHQISVFTNFSFEVVWVRYFEQSCMEVPRFPVLT